jgi:hypothetical protein
VVAPPLRRIATACRKVTAICVLTSDVDVCRKCSDGETHAQNPYFSPRICSNSWAIVSIEMYVVLDVIKGNTSCYKDLVCAVSYKNGGSETLFTRLI